MEMLKLGIVFVALLFLTSIAFAEKTVASEFKDLWKQGDFPWEGTAIILSLLSFSIAAIAFMFARIFQSNEMERWAKGEFMFTLSTVFLIAMIIFFVDILANEVAQFSMIVSRDRPALLEEFRKDPSPFTVANFYLEKMGNCAKSRYIDLVCIWSVPSAIQSIEKTTPGGVVKPFNAGFSYFTNLVNYTMHNLIYVIYTIDFQAHLLQFIKQTMLVVFLPVGIILRAFVLTRGAGNLFISVALALFFIYPIMYGVFISISQPIDQFELQCGITGGQNVEDYYNTGPCTDTITQLSSFGFSTVSRLVRSSDNIFTQSYSVATQMIGLLDKLEFIVSEMMLFTVFYPFAAATVVFTFIKAFTIFLGTDAQEFAQGLVKLI